MHPHFLLTLFRTKVERAKRIAAQPQRIKERSDAWVKVRRISERVSLCDAERAALK